MLCDDSVAGDGSSGGAVAEAVAGTLHRCGVADRAHRARGRSCAIDFLEQGRRDIGASPAGAKRTMSCPGSRATT